MCLGEFAYLMIHYFFIPGAFIIPISRGFVWLVRACLADLAWQPVQVENSHIFRENKSRDGENPNVKKTYIKIN